MFNFKWLDYGCSSNYPNWGKGGQNLGSSIGSLLWTINNSKFLHPPEMVSGNVSVSSKRYHSLHASWGKFSKTGEILVSWENFVGQIPHPWTNSAVQLPGGGGGGLANFPTLNTHLTLTFQFILLPQQKDILKETKIYTGPNRKFIGHNFYLSTQFIKRLCSLVCL